MSGSEDNTVKVWSLESGKEEFDQSHLADLLSGFAHGGGREENGSGGGLLSGGGLFPLPIAEGLVMTLGFSGAIVRDVLLSQGSGAPPLLLKGQKQCVE